MLRALLVATFHTIIVFPDEGPLRSVTCIGLHYGNWIVMRRMENVKFDPFSFSLQYDSFMYLQFVLVNTAISNQKIFNTSFPTS
jgi:hypothetical protein